MASKSKVVVVELPVEVITHTIAVFSLYVATCLLIYVIGHSMNINSKIRVTGIVIATLVLFIAGCGHDSKLLVGLDVDERLKEDCPKDLPELKTAEDADNVNWSKDMITIYVKCAKDKRELVNAINAFNAKVAKPKEAVK